MKKIIILLTLMMSFNSFAAVTQNEFNTIIKNLNTIYKPIVAEAGGNLFFIANWSSSMLNAKAERIEATNRWEVYAYGGLARLSHMTKDGYALVLCHELGHHLGGYPKKRRYTTASTEGQADYFATLKCSRKLFALDDNEAVLKKLNVPSIVKEKCNESFSNNNEVNICIRSAMASKDLTTSMEILGAAPYGDKPRTMDFEKQARPLPVKFISEDHGLSDCRLNTLFQASLCDKNVDEKLSDIEDTTGICSKANGDTRGLRPQCWYKID